MELKYKPVTSDLWPQFEALFGKRGGCGGCWCMWFRLSHSEFEASKGEKNRRTMREIITSDVVPGIIAFDGDVPVGWISVALRDEFSRLARSRILKPVDDKPVWSIVCQFVTAAYRRRGVSKGLISAAVKYVQDRGGGIVEAYAVEPKKDSMPDTFAYHGLARAYLACGFEEVARRSETRPIMRHYL